jgi:hypothetical protein
MEQSGIHLTKEVFVALIHAYPACGEFDVEKQVCLCKYAVFLRFLFWSDLVKDIACCQSHGRVLDYY